MVTRRRSLLQAVNSGTSVEVLRASERQMAKAMADPETPPAALAALARELRMTRAAIDAAGHTTTQGDDLDDLAARREARLAR